MAEGKIRFDQTEGYTTLLNNPVRDSRLSLKTVGLLLVMKSLINTEWEFSVSGLAKYRNVGKDTVRGCLKELEEAGYLLRQRTHKDDGTFGENEYVIFETSKKPLVDSDDSDHRREIPTMDKTQRRLNPSSDNQTQIKDITQVKENNIPPISPKREKRPDGLGKEAVEMLEAYKRDKPPELAAALDGFMVSRRERRAGTKVRALELFFNKLDKLSGGNNSRRLALINEAEERGWKTVFPLKDDKRVPDKPDGEAQGEDGDWL